MASNNGDMSDSSQSDHSQDDSEYNYIENYEFDNEIVGSLASEELRGGYQPYSGEPEADEEWLREFYAEKQKENERNEELERRQEGLVFVSSWCRCGKCNSEFLQNPREFSCCQEVNECLEALNDELLEEIPRCITEHPGFDAVCLNEWTLRLAADKYRRIDGRKYTQSGSDKAFLRAVSYRQFTHLVHGYIGRSKRIPIPACALNTIRSTFRTDQDSEFVGFISDGEEN